MTGINQSASLISEKKQNKHLRIFELSSTKIIPKVQKQIFPLSLPFNPEIYQHQTCFNRHTQPTLLAITSTSGDLSVLSFPNLEQIYFTNVHNDIYSLEFSPADNSDAVLFPNLIIR